MKAAKISTCEARVMQALRAGTMSHTELLDRFPSGIRASRLLKLGYVENDATGYKLTELGRSFCPLRRNIEKAAYLPPANSEELKPIKQSVIKQNNKVATTMTFKEGRAFNTFENPTIKVEANMPPHTNVAKQIRDIIIDHPGIEHKELIAKITNNSTDYDETTKAANMITYVLKYGGFTKCDDFKVGTLEKSKHYYTDEAFLKRKLNAQSHVTNNIPTQEQHHKAKTPTEKKEKQMNTNAVPEQIPQQPVISITFAIQLPEMPNQLKLVGLKKSDLDDAIASGDSYTVDVATLDENAVDALCAQWAEKFKAHVQARKQTA